MTPFSFDASVILPGLLVGSRPPPGTLLADEGVDVLLLCASEIQDPGPYLCVEVWTCGFEDGPLDRQTANRADAAARAVADAWRERKTVLVTCAMGLNRSAFVAALAVRLIQHVPGKTARQLVQTARPGALFNPDFVSYLDALPAP